MKAQKAIEHFGSVIKLADALDITRDAVYKWGDTVPELTAYKLQVLTAGKLQVDPRCYPDRRSA
jgi:hypothetical protein